MKRSNLAAWSAIGILSALGQSLAGAVEIHWNNAAGGDWATAGNWNPAQVPTLSDDVVVDLAGSYTIVIGGSRSANTLTISNTSAGIELRAVNGIHATLTLAAGGTNHGTFQMTSTHASYHSTLSVSAGTFTNAADGEIVALNGSGGNRSISGHLKNQGTLTVEAGRTLPLTGIYEVAGGTYTGDAYLNSSEVRVTASPAAPTTVVLRGNCTLTTDNLANVVLHNLAINGIPANLTLPGAAVNQGTIRLDSSHASYHSTLIVAAGALTNAADGVIEAAATLASNRGIVGSLANAGTISVAPGLTLEMSGTNAVLALNAGQVTGGGAFQLSGSTTTCTWNGGTTGTTTVMFNSNLDIPVGSTGTGTILCRGSCTLAGEIHPGQTVHLQAVVAFHATTTIPADLTNHGTIRMDSTNSSYNVTLNANSVLTNAADGLIDVVAGVGAFRTFNGHLKNQGVITVAADRSLPMNGIYEVAGGTYSGDAYVNSSEVSVTASPTSETTVVLRGNCTLTTDNLANVVLNNLAVAGIHANLTLPVGVTNHGTLQLDSLNASYHSTLTVASGALSNAADGLIDAAATVPSQRNLIGSMINAGTISPASGVTLAMSGTNAALILNGGDIGGGGVFQLSGDTTTCTWNGGTVSGTAVLMTSNLIIPNGSTGTGTILCRGSCTLAGEVESGQTVHVQAIAGFHGTTTVPADLTNHGTIRMDSTHGAYNATLNAGAVLTNAADGLIDVVAGAGASRTFNGHLKNQGAVAVEAGPALPINGIYEVAGGTYSGDAYVNFSEVRVTASPASETTVVLRGNCTLTTDNLANVVLNNLAVGGIHANLALPVGVTNHGTLRLDSQHASYHSTLTVASGALTNAADGLIDAASTVPSQRNLVGSMTNAGTISPASAVTLAMSGTNAAFVLNGGIIGGSGVFQLSGNTTICTWNGGSVSGTAILLTSNLVIPDGSTGTGTVLCRGSCTLAGEVESGQTMHLESVAGIHSTMTVPANLINHGTIRMDSTHPGYNTTLNAGAVLTNAADGLIDVIAGAGALRTFNGHLKNQGVLTVASGPALPMNGIYEVAGGTYSGDAYVNASEVRVTASPAAETSVILRGACTLTTDNLTNVVLVNRAVGGIHANLTTASGTANHGTILLESTHVAYGSTLTAGGAGFTNAPDGLIDALVTAGGARAIAGVLTNDGLLHVDAGLTLVHSGALANFSAGTLTGGVYDLAGIYRFPSAAVAMLNATLILDGAPSSLLNHNNGLNALANLATVGSAGLLRLRNSRDLTTTVATFSNDGDVELGAGCNLNIVGGFAQTAGGRLALDLAGYHELTDYGRVTCSAAVALDGELAAVLVGGYMPLIGHRFRALTHGARTGVFSPFTPPTLGGNAVLGTDYRNSELWLVTTTDACLGFAPCDSNCDGSANQFDIESFINTLITRTSCSPCASDMNGDATLNAFDINGFLQCLGA